jgi:hypothetical protein
MSCSKCEDGASMSKNSNQYADELEAEWYAGIEAELYGN